MALHCVLVSVLIFAICCLGLCTPYIVGLQEPMEFYE